MTPEPQHTIDSACTYGIAGGCYLVGMLADIASVSQSLVVIISLLIAFMRLINDVNHYSKKIKKWLRGDDKPPKPPIV